MSKRELIVEELNRLPEQDLERVLGLLRAMKESQIEDALSTLGAESALSRDWLTPEEDAAWANL